MPKKLAESKWAWIIVLALGFFLRVYNAPETFLYSHDQDLAGWIIKDIIVDHHPRLIGQMTSTPGIFIGPLFYYFLIPFYLFFKMEPIGGVVAVSLLGLATMASYVFVFSKIFGKLSGLVAGIIYAASFYMVFNDREVVPTMPVMLWSVWYLYALSLLLKGQKAGYILAGALFGLIWHINMALALVVPLVPLSITLSKKKYFWENGLRGLGIFGFLSLPLAVFELRHGFSQTKAFLDAFTTNQQDIVSGVDKLQRTLFFVSKNTHNFVLGPLTAPFWLAAFILTIGFFFLWKKKVISTNLALIMMFWWIIYVAFFGTYSKAISEYYFNGPMVVWVATVALVVTHLLSSRRFWYLGVGLLTFFLAFNVYRIANFPVNRSGYLEKKELVRFIQADKEARGYPCVAISYITLQGYELGWRYLFWLEKTQLNRPQVNIPVYSIVFPHSKVGRIDKSFGALGLVFPGYERYSPEKVKQSCSSDNINLTEPMLLFTN